MRNSHTYLKLFFTRIKLCAPPTSTSANYGSEMFYREGFVLSLSLEDGSTGYGEVRQNVYLETISSILLLVGY